MSTRILGGRYELMEEIGGGGMALVYRATDTLLGRTVAVKMLRPQFAGDDEFVARFRQEAQAAARLSHPNIVNLYDVGVVNDEYYIVMEFVDGPTLKGVILDRAPLSAEETVRITSQICAALEHAHEHHIIHRDIKPHNILMTKSGIVKVADFGIARAGTGNTITDHQATSVLGSVHYFSPEQARGGQTDVKSDIYSLGIVMYEMLTGRLPFSGDSPVSVALKHLRDRIVEPREYVRSIPQSVENIVLRSLVKSPERRYSNMAAVQADLKEALQKPNVPKFVIPNESFDETIAIPALGPFSVPGTSEDSQQPKQKRPWWKPVLWTFLGLVVAAAGIVAAYYFVWTLLDGPRNLNLPNVVGMTESQAMSKLTAAGIPKEHIKEQKAANLNRPSGVVYDQSPEGPTQVKDTRDITLYVSTGSPQIQVPPVAGVPIAEALQTIINQGFNKSNIVQQQVQSSTVPSGDVIGTVPAANATVASDSKITVQVSQGQMVTIPPIVGSSYSNAVAALQAANLQVGQITPVVFPGVQNQTVVRIGTYSVGASVPAGTPIDLYVADNGTSAPAPTNNTGNGTGVGENNTSDGYPSNNAENGSGAGTNNNGSPPVPGTTSLNGASSGNTTNG